MLRQIRPAIVLIVLMTVLTGLAYPLVITGVAGVLFPHQAAGSLIEQDGKVIGSELIGQNFTDAKYFHGRPSATTDTDPNDATKTIPAPYNAAQFGRLQCRADLEGVDRAGAGRCRRAEEGKQRADPGRSGHHLGERPRSGHHPRRRRVPGARASPRPAICRPSALRALVADQTQGRVLGIFGEPRVNVLKLNLALDALK